jgi:putative SOS response-associated peptidase YedK
MCGRYSLSTPSELLAELLELDAAPELAPRYNIAPTQPAPVVRLAPGGRRVLETMRWGLQGIGSVPTVINARAETAATKAGFADAFARRRCLVPADGFFEWRREGAVRQPYLVRPAAGGLFAFAGLWDPWSAQEEEIHGSFAILTTDATPAIAWLHDRMPVILPRAAHTAWLGEDSSEELAALLVPFPDPLETYPVSTFVNSADREGSECVVRVAPTQPSLFG